MTTTVMRDSMVGDSWIREMCALNPVQRVLDDKGQATGNLLTGPVRLAFCDSLFEAKPQMRTDPNSKKTHSAAILFTPFTDLTIFWEEYYKICASDFAQYYNPTYQMYSGLENPIFDAGTKLQYGGFTPGCMAMNSSSQYKPPLVDMRNNPIVDPNKVYPGVWAICSVAGYASGKNFPKKGPRFGLQSIMIIGDDKPLAGGAVDPRTQFKTANVKPPVGIPAGAFGQPVQTPTPGAGVAAMMPPPGIPGGVGMPTPVVGRAGGMVPPPIGAPPSDEDLTGLI